MAGTDAPLMTVRLMRGQQQGRPRGPIADPRTGLPLEQHLAGVPNGQLTRWTTTLDLPTPWQTGRYAVHVEEREWLAADQRPTGKTVMAPRGSPFHALIPLDPT